MGFLDITHDIGNEDFHGSGFYHGYADLLSLATALHFASCSSLKTHRRRAPPTKIVVDKQIVWMYNLHGNNYYAKIVGEAFSNADQLGW